MKIKQIFITILLWFGFFSTTHAQTFDNLWKQVQQAEKKSLPKTVIELTTEIFQKAKAEKNSPQMLKAYMWRMQYRDMLTPDSFYVNIKGLEQWVKVTPKPLDQAILHSLLAGIYADYASQNRWQIRERAEIADQSPDSDIREWSGQMFVTQVRRHTTEALKDSVLLIETSSRTYIPFVKLGNTSIYYQHDMYHLLGSRGIDALRQVQGMDMIMNKEISRIYQDMENAYLSRGDKDAYILVRLGYLDWKLDSHPAFRSYQAPTGLLGLTQNPYLAGLNELLSRFKSQEVCAEVYLAKARYAKNKGQETMALQICDEAIRLYPKYNRINALRNLKEDILTPSLSATADEVVYPGKKVTLKVNHKNLDGFTLLLFQAKKQVFKQHFSLLRPGNYQMQDTTFSFTAPALGKYVMRIVPDVRAKRNSESDFYVTKFKVLTCRLPQGQYEIVTLNAETGHPIPGSTVILYANDEKELKQLTTDAQGKAVLPWDAKYRFLSARKGQDAAMPKQYIYGGTYGYYQEGNKAAEHIDLLTDRSLYRPGQTIYIKGIAYEQKEDTAHVLANQSYTVTLSDPNSQEVGKKSVRTNDYGSFVAEFVLPSACLNGMFRIQAGKNSTFIRVEDYKRPTFNITFEKRQASYQVGDEIQVKGKVESYSGVALQETPVEYVVKRSVYNLWRMTTSEEIDSGTVTTGQNGEFSIPVLLEEDEEYEGMQGIYFRYSVEATVTNVAGETQSSTDIIFAGERSMLLGVNGVEELVCKDTPFKVEVTARNLNGQPVEVSGNYRLYPTTDKDTKKKEGTPAFSGTFVANQEIELDWKSLPAGVYTLVVSAKDNQGKDVTFDKNVILFSLKDNHPPVKVEEWYYPVNTEFDLAHPAVFYYGTSEKDAYVLMDVFSGDTRLESKVLNLSDSIVRFEYPYKESYNNGISITFCLVKDGQVYQQQVKLKKRLPDKTLVMKWDVFRDKLRPGEKEEWRLTIKTPQGTPAAAEMLATMYDASLDKIWKRNQSLQVTYPLLLPTSFWMANNRGRNGFNFWWPDTSLKVPSLSYDHFVLSPSLRVYDMVEQLEASSVAYGANSKKMAVTGAIKMRGVLAGQAVADMGEVPSATQESEQEPEPMESATELRTNFAETAFFYPQLRTNEQGEISFSFTMPQSLTTWNFRGYSHTKGMLTGTLDAEVVTSKEFMLTPNLPRFVRVGDKTSVAASISNLTGKNISGTVYFTLFNPENEKTISTQKQSFSVEAGKTVGVSFMFNVTDKYEILGCRLVADGGNFSDGEQHLLPVLSNKENITESVPMAVRGKETRTFSLDSLFNHHSKTATDRRLTIEFTGNPTWYAVQALPALGMPDNDNAISWASAYYANSLASFIMNSQPRIKAVFDSWKLQGGTKETFLSNLEKNTEVKNILLSESPWVMQAKTEAEQQQRIATLFDLNNIRNNNAAALAKLKELQMADGAWSWYKGMQGSRYVTDFIVELTARLALLTKEPLEKAALTMQSSAFKFLHAQALKEYQDILKAQKEGSKITGISSSALRYLYLIAISGEKIPAANEAAYRYFLSKVGSLLSSGGMDQKALAAIVLQKAGRGKEASSFMASLKQHLVETPAGMHFAFYESPYTWAGMQIPVHVQVMEAFETVTHDTKVIEEMKLWLLQQKQTSQWNSPVATVDAVYALLQQGSDLLDSRGEVRISIAGQTLDTSATSANSIAGLGYIKETFTDKKVVDAKQIKIEKLDSGLAWGAVYAQYESPISDVKQQGGELNVKKELYVERTVNNAPRLEAITGNSVLQVGDKIVSRLIIKLDRAMDFVQLKDQRGACFEPVEYLSGYRWNKGLGYYVDVKDASTNFFFDQLGKGVYVLEYSYRVSRAGTYETGLAVIQCAYAPQYVSHSSSMKVNVK